jgi:outer membrane lipoprotein LolB
MKRNYLICKPAIPALLVLMLFLSGCSTTSVISSSRGKASDPALQKIWQQHRSQLQGIADWTLTGKLGLRSPDKNGSARLSWQQRDQSYHIDFTDPLGRNSLQLVGNPDYATIRVPNQKPVTTDEPEALLFDNIGWMIPISELPHWILGYPAPDTPAVYNLNTEGRLATLSQSGWYLEFLGYQQVGLLWLPKKISIEQDDIKLKFVISQWTVNTSTISKRHPDHKNAASTVVQYR